MSLQEERCKVDGPFSTSHLFMYTHLERPVYNMEGVSLIIIKLVLKKTMLYTVIIISLSGKVVYPLFLIYCLSEPNTFEIMF